MRDLTIIIVTFNSSADIEPCLSSIYAQKISFDLEAIVFDNNSSDHTTSIVQDKFKDATLILSKTNLGFAAANNEAAQKSHSDILFFLNPDTKLTEGSLQSLYDETRKTGVERIILVPAQYSYDGASFIHCGLGLDIFGFPINEHGSENFFYADGAALCIKKKDFLGLGMFDEAFFLIAEDVDLSWKARLMGYELRCIREVKIYHKIGGSIGCGSSGESNISTSLLRRYHGEKNIIRNILKNYSWWNVCWVLPLVMMTNFLEMILFLLIGRPKVALCYLRAYSWNLRNFQGTLEKRRWIQGRRLVGDAQVMRHMYKGSSRFRLLLKGGIPKIN